MPQRSERIKSLATVSQFRVGALLVQPERLLVVNQGQEVALEPRLMEVLLALAERAGEVVSADQLLIEVWRGTFYGDNPVHRAIAQLRRLIGDSSRTPIYIETIRKRGYRLIAKVLFPDNYRRTPHSETLWTQGSPYVGLTAFDGRHTNVFFGRSRMIAELLIALRRQIENQRRFVLLVGASGCGKTSLLRAGAIPLLRQEGGFNGLQSLAVAYCDLAGCQGGDVLLQLASGLSTWSLEQRPVFAPQSMPELAERLRQRPDLASTSVADAFLRTPSLALADRPFAHLLLVIDHGEALVAVPGIDQAEREALSHILSQLCDNPHVAVAMIARSDFYPRLIEAMPGIVELKAGDGHVDVLKPRSGEIAQIIRAPAMLAGLVFEEDPETLTRLDDTLRDAALEHADALPLLQHALHMLYECKTTSGELTFRGYREIGGLIGALAHRAEEVFASLPVGAQRSLGRVLSLLVVIQPDSDSVSAQRASWSALEDDPQRMLVETFIRARLFVGELRNGLPVFGVAHEALLRQWPRVSEWTQDNRRLLQARARLRRATSRWAEEGRSEDYLLNPGQPLHEAREAARFAGSTLHGDERDFLRACERQHRFRRWLRVGALVSLIAFSGISVLFGVRAQSARRDAEHHREEALRLADFMLVDLADKLRPLGNLKLLASIGTEAMSYLGSRPQREMRTEDLINHSRALRTVGEVMIEQARIDAARSAFTRADAVARQAVAQAPDSTDALAESGVASYWLGYYYYRQRQLDEASAQWSNYRETSQRVMQLEPDNPKWAVELSYALNNLGTVARDQGRIDTAIDDFKRSARLKKAAIARLPDDAALRYDLIDTLSWISSADESQGRLADAADGYAEQLRMLRALIAEHRDARAWERRLATSLVRSATLAVARGQLTEAHEQIEESVARLSRLVGQEPANRVWQRDLAHAHMEAGRIASLNGRDASRGTHLRAARSLSAALTTDAEPLPEWRRLDALIRLYLAQHDRNVTTNAAEFERVVANLDDLAERAPRDISATIALANALIVRGQWRERHAAAADAHADWQRASVLLASEAATSKDKLLLDPWLSAQMLLGRQADVAERILWLQGIGYRQPEFLALASRSNVRGEVTRDMEISSRHRPPPNDPGLRRD